mgnify:FL=1
MNEKQITSLFKRKGFVINKYWEEKGTILVDISKDYSKGFNIEFNGYLNLLVKINKNFFGNECKYLFNPAFYELNNVIPKKVKNHFYIDGSICYAPPERPLNEKWQLLDYIEAVDSVINDWFNKEYIGVSKLHGLEHGEKGKIQYHYLKNNFKQK